MIKTFSAVVVLLVLSACGARAGDRCDNSWMTCEEGGKSALICENGFVRQYACPGARGCWAVGSNRTYCEFVGSHAGDACPTTLGELGFCRDAQTMLSCRDGRWTVVDCAGCSARPNENGIDVVTCG